MEFWLFPGFRRILQYVHGCCFFYSCIYYFAPFSIEILACLTDSYSPRAKNALNSCMSCNFAILKKYGRKIAPDLTGITREVHKS